MIRVISAIVFTSIVGATVMALVPPKLATIHARDGGQQPPAAKTIPAPADVAKPPASAATTASGLASKVLQAGKGTAKPTATDLVTVHYTGWTTDGKMFDSSVLGGKPVTFPLNRLIKGWGEGVPLMVV